VDQSGQFGVAVVTDASKDRRPKFAAVRIFAMANRAMAFERGAAGVLTEHDRGYDDERQA